MSHDTKRLAAAELRERARTLRKLKGSEAFRPFLLKDTAGWALVSQGLVTLIADQLDDIANEMLSGKVT